MAADGESVHAGAVSGDPLPPGNPAIPRRHQADNPFKVIRRTVVDHLAVVLHAQVLVAVLAAILLKHVKGLDQRAQQTGPKAAKVVRQKSGFQLLHGF